MTTEITQFINDLTNSGEEATISSLKVAERFGRNHRDVLRAIQNLGCPTEFTERNFALSEYIDPTGRKLPEKAGPQ